MSPIGTDALTTDEVVPPRSRTFSPEVVKQVHDYFNPGEGEEAHRNVGIGSFDKEGAARSALTTLNKLLHDSYNVGPYAATVRKGSDGKWKAILLNKPAKKKAEQTTTTTRRGSGRR